MKMINYINFSVNSNEKIKTFKNEHKKEKQKKYILSKMYFFFKKKKVLLYPGDHNMNFIAAFNGIVKDFYLDFHKHEHESPSD